MARRSGAEGPCRQPHGGFRSCKLKPSMPTASPDEGAARAVHLGIAPGRSLPPAWPPSSGESKLQSRALQASAASPSRERPGSTTTVMAPMPGQQGSSPAHLPASRWRGLPSGSLSLLRRPDDTIIFSSATAVGPARMTIPYRPLRAAPFQRQAELDQLTTLNLHARRQLYGLLGWAPSGVPVALGAGAMDQRS